MEKRALRAAKNSLKQASAASLFNLEKKAS
jgi:hypothetical protein